MWLCDRIAENKELQANLLNELSIMAINKVAPVVFDRISEGNAFWESQVFTVRDDLICRNKSLAEITQIDT